MDARTKQFEQHARATFGKLVSELRRNHTVALSDGRLYAFGGAESAPPTFYPLHDVSAGYVRSSKPAPKPRRPRCELVFY